MADVTDWIGKSETTQDIIDYGLVHKMAATLGTEIPDPASALPHLWHWMFFQPSIPFRELGDDGHPARGGFLPPADNRNRMWAGGRLQFLHPLMIGHAAKRISTIKNIVEKQGKTGALLFVTVEHNHIQNGQSAVLEEQDIVYREPSPYSPAKSTPCPLADWSETHHSSPVTLFRYSALTFNAHRIHYDYPYATGIEGYPGLVVQGQLLATLALHAFEKANRQADVCYFSFRSQRPIINPDTFITAGKITDVGKADLWVGNDNGIAQTCNVGFALK